ncbi:MULTISPECIES: hypothetical protein [Bacillati]|uniref:Uncharacterized protein n=3 Tax=Bacillati TaxID=1783272 RepID=A0ABN3UYR7_9ACTN
MSLEQAIVDELYARRGFDYWWDDIDEDVREEILEALAETIEDHSTGRVRVEIEEHGETREEFLEPGDEIVSDGPVAVTAVGFEDVDDRIL